jgi:hypothetical protein
MSRHLRITRAAPAEAPLQRKPDLASESRPAAGLRPRHVSDVAAVPPARRNETGLPDRLKLGVESLSGFAMDDVKVHYNSARPAQLRAHAFAQGSHIHVGPGQERHLAHEAWHVVQQKQGRVRPTLQMKGVDINDDAALEREADAMGARATQPVPAPQTAPPAPCKSSPGRGAPMQRLVINYQPGDATARDAAANLPSDPKITPRELGSQLIGLNEDIYLVGHGGGMGQNRLGGSKGSATKVAGMSASDLAATLGHHLPDRYAGKIYIIGCSVAGMAPMSVSNYLSDFERAIRKGQGVRVGEFSVHGAAGDVTVFPDGSIGYEPQTLGHALAFNALRAANKGLSDLHPASANERAKVDELKTKLAKAQQMGVARDLTTVEDGEMVSPDISDPLGDISFDVMEARISKLAGYADRFRRPGHVAANQRLQAVAPAPVRAGVGSRIAAWFNEKFKRKAR